jgi:hypothetical protein
VVKARAYFVSAPLIERESRDAEDHQSQFSLFEKILYMGSTQDAYGVLSHIDILAKHDGHAIDITNTSSRIPYG